MKVIAIVNLPFDVDPNKEDAYFVMRDGKYCQRVCLRPLPQFKEEAVPYQVSETEVDCYQDPYATGFNDAIRFITGETE